ncbi:amino acid ABC transporter substrate-binding protein [Candidatus Bipolaricaulota bacterium]|nr:amino acid ABC transporter substrate-binding protein [Candidatus Bipolaricaulota bacterium]
MKNYKPLLVLFLVGILSISLATTAIGQDGVIEKVKETGVLTVGCREAARPFAYVNEDGDMVGFSQDLAFLLGAKLEERVGREVKIKQVPFAGASRVPIVAQGTIDIEMGSSTHTAPRDDVLDFSLPYFLSETVFMVRAGEGIDSLDDLDGKIVGSMRATTNLKALQEIVDKGEIDPRNVVVVETHARGFQSLQTKKIDAYFTDTSLLTGIRAEAKNPEDYKIVTESIHAEPYGWMMRENDSDWRDFVNNFLIWTLKTDCSAELDTLSELGILEECEEPNFTIFDAVYDKWMGPNTATPIPRTEGFNHLLKNMQFTDIEEVWPTKD